MAKLINTGEVRALEGSTLIEKIKNGLSIEHQRRSKSYKYGRIIGQAIVFAAILVFCALILLFIKTVYYAVLGGL